MARVVVFVADGCHLCTVAVELVREVCDAAGEAFDVVGIDGDDELERRYRVLLPVIEVDGREHAHFEVDPAALAAALRP